ncbi:basement membrane-specific heparan sulfate proteoglycan core protein-like [Salvelinus alpinus]
MENTMLCVLLLLSILIYCGHCGEDDERLVAVLTLQPNWTQKFRGDSDWQYEWHNNRKSIYSNTNPGYRISPVYRSNRGSYTCQGVKGNKRSETSDAVQLTVSALPTASVSISPQGLLYSGETVTLQCDIPDYKDWTYHWYRNNQPGSSTHGKTITISLPDQDGQYQCEGTRTDQPQKSQLSRAISIQFIALPTASVSIYAQGPLYSGETVTLQCVIPGYTDWTYLWSRNNQQLSSQTSETITISLPDQAGQYQCQGTRTTRPQWSNLSSSLPIIVTALPETTLTVEPNPVFPGETVTLTCSVGSDSNWSYKWYKDRNDNDVSQSVIHTITGDTLTINRAAESDQGLYWCQGQRRSRPTSSQPSNVITLTVNALPTASVSTSPQGPLYSGETVTLQCDIPDYTDWTYYWYINNQPFSSAHGKTITISLHDQAGQYQCMGTRTDWPQKSQLSRAPSIQFIALPTASVSIYAQGPLYSGETVTLQCVIPGYTDWMYYWYRNNQQLSSQTSETITISLPDQAGQYQCQGKRTRRPQWSNLSSSLPIIVTALPETTLTVEPNPVFPGETVTLTCSVGSDSNWSYQWYKDHYNNVVSQSVRHTTTGDTLTISRAAESDQGLYLCQGQRRSRPTSSQPSNVITLTVNALPTTSVSISPQGLLYSGETVSMQCDISMYTDWTYSWFIGNNFKSSTPGQTITTLSNQAGQYRCVGVRTGRPQWSQLSVFLPIRVTDNQPSTTLTLDKEDVFTGDSVTLSCTVESSGWKFYWYRHRPDSTPVTTTSGYSYTLSWVSVSDGGQYWCRAGRGDPVYYTLYSDPVQINITERPVAVLTLQPNWTQIFSGETVTMRCDIQGGGDSDWNYRWYKNSQLVLPFNTKPEYRISPVYMSNSGSYTCKGVKGNKFSKISDAVQLTVSDQPQPVLSISPQWLNPGDSVTLSCEVDKMSTGWRFSWYRAVYTLTEQSYYFERLPDRGNMTTEDSYTLIPAGPTPTGGYVCRAGRGDPVYDTLYSEPQFLWSGDRQSSVSLRISPNTTQHFRSKTLSLICEEKGKSTGWRLMRYTERGVESGCVSNWGSITGSTCTISYTYTWYSGVFWCESGSGEYSNAVNITVPAGDVILESPVHPVTEGDSVTLHCKYWTTSSNIKADFYKDGVLIKNGTTGEMTIPTVSKSDEGFYKCKYPDKGESPESWVTVRIVSPGSSTSVLEGVVVGLVIFGVLLVILLVLLWRYKNAKGSCFNRIFSNPQTQRTNQDPQQDQGSTQGQDPDAGYTLLQHGDDHIYDTINPSENNDNEKPADPKESPVYSEVKTGKATAAAEPVDVTYAEVVLQKKNKAKKKRETTTPTEADSVYSQLKPGTTQGP